MCGLTDPSGCIADAAKSSLEAFADATADAAAWIITESMTWWVDTDGAELNTSLVAAIRDVTMPLTVSVAAAGMILFGIRMVISGSPDPLLGLGEGIAKMTFWTISGTTVINAFMQVSAAFSDWVLGSVNDRDLGEQLVKAFHGGPDASGSPGTLLLLSLAGFFAGAVQWMISFFREGAAVILTGCLSLAASGTLGVNNRWLGRITGWCLALIFWMPAACLVYFAAFAMMQDAQGQQEMLVGIAMIGITIIQLPVMIRLFNWMVTEGVGGAGGSSKLQGAAMAYQLRAAARSGGGRMSPDQHARLIDNSLPRQGSPTGSRPTVAQPGEPSGAVPGSRTPTSEGNSGTGTATDGTRAARGAKAASAAGPLGLAAAAVAAGTAGAKAAAHAMTEGANATPPTPPPNRPSGSRKDGS